MALSPRLRWFSIFVVAILILRALYVQKSKPITSKSVEKIHNTAVERWLIEEVGVPLNIPVALQSLGLCANTNHIPRCIKDILSATEKISDVQHSGLLKLFRSQPQNGKLGNHLYEEAKKKKEEMVFFEWLMLHNLLTNTVKEQLQRQNVFSMKDLSRFCDNTIDSQTTAHHIIKVGKLAINFNDCRYLV